VLGEDASRVRLGAGPLALATCRDTARSLLRWVGCRQLAARLRDYGQDPTGAVALLRRPITQNA
jgi:hypothetical protein